VTVPPGWDGVPVNEKHARLLESHAVTPEEALSSTTVTVHGS